MQYKTGTARVVADTTLLGALSAAAGAAGNVNVGTHSWKVTAVHANGGETALGTVSNQLNITTSAKHASLTSVPTGPSGTISRKIYRTVAGDTGNYLFVGSIADNTTTTFDDNVADGSLGSAGPTSSTFPTDTIELNGGTTSGNISSGRVFKFKGEVNLWFTVSSVPSSTTFLLTTKYNGSKVAGTFYEYEVVTGYTTLLSLPEIAKGDVDTADVYTLMTRILDAIVNTQDSFNYSFNGDMQIWGAGVSAAPTGWTLAGASATSAKNTTNFKHGTSSADLTRAGTDCTLSQAVNGFAEYQSPSGITWWQGKYVSLSVWVRATVASRARVGITDGTGTFYSPYHSGSGLFELLTVTRRIDPAAGSVTITLAVDTGNTTAQFDGVTLISGKTPAVDFVPSAWRGRKSTWTFGPNPQVAHTQATTWYYNPGSVSGTEAQVSLRVPFNAIARNLRVETDVNVGGAAQTVTFTLRTGEATDTALTAQIASGARTGSDLTHEVALTAGQLITCKIVTSATTGTVVPHAVMELEEIP